VIDTMRQKYPQKQAVKYEVGDICDLSHLVQDDSMDVIIDKGTLDSILCCEEGGNYVGAMLQEMNRVLAEKGVYVVVTAENRRHYFETSGWNVSAETLTRNKPLHDSFAPKDAYHFFIMSKSKVTV